MDEQEWAGATDPEPMLTFLRASGSASDRKLRFFAAQCARGVWGSIRDPEGLRAVEVGECFADGLAPLAELQSASAAAERVSRSRLGGDGDDARLVALHVVETDAFEAAYLTAQEAAIIPAAVAERKWQLATGEEELPEDAWRPHLRKAREWHAALLRDLFGPLPFHPVTVDVRLLSDNRIIKPAQDAYDQRRLPEGTLHATLLAALADALEQASCENQEVIAHLRTQDVSHVRGCWAIDLLLGRA